jgi:hypothetical protein
MEMTLSKKIVTASRKGLELSLGERLLRTAAAI